MLARNSHINLKMANSLINWEKYIGKAANNLGEQHTHGHLDIPYSEKKFKNDYFALH